MRVLAAGIALSVALGLAAAPADACGDKLLVIGRRVKRVPSAKHPAVVLLYMRPGSALPAAAKEMHLEATLRQAGHRVDTVKRADRLRGELASGRYDFVLTDLADAESVAREAGAVPGAPEVVPVAYEAGDAVLQDSRQAFEVVIEAGRGRAYLSDLDAAMRQRDER
jgi:hypothetical protein